MEEGGVEERHPYRSRAPGVRTRDQSYFEIKGGAPSTAQLGAISGVIPLKEGPASSEGALDLFAGRPPSSLALLVDRNKQAWKDPLDMNGPRRSGSDIGCHSS